MVNEKTKFILAAALLCFFACQFCVAQEKEDWDWVDKQFDAILNEFLPIDESGSLAYRSYRDLYTDVFEYSFVFSENWNEKRIDVVVRMADTVSLYDQMMALHRKNPDASFESIKTKLKVKEWRLNNSSCSAVKTAYEEFDNLSLPILSAKDKAERDKGIATITLHPTIHTFRASVSGGQMRLVLREDEHRFVRWALKTRKALEKCIVKNTGR